MSSSTLCSDIGGDKERLRGSDTVATSCPLRRIWAVLSFLSLALVSIWLIGEGLAWATRQYDFSEPKALESLAFKSQRFDVAYFGDSLTLEGVSPIAIDGLIGTVSYNFALGGASILESELQLRHFVRNNAKPRLVALGLYVNKETSVPGIRPTVYFALESELRTLFRSRFRQLTGRGLEDSFLVFNVIPAYRHRNSLDLLLKELASRGTRRPQFQKGQALATFTTVLGHVELGQPHRVQLPEDELKSFLAFCASEQMRVYIFEPPNHPGYSELSIGRTEALQRLRGLVAEWPDVAFETPDDLPKVEYEGTDWVNLNHLNAFGSRKYASVLAPRIGELLSRGNRTSTPRPSEP